MLEHLKPKTVIAENKPSMEDALQAVKTLLLWIGENPDREGLLKTPQRVINSYEEMFSGYQEDPAALLSCKFSEVGDYQEPVLVKNIALESFCEHHMLPFLGKAHVAYQPQGGVVGISKLARLVDIFARRLQSQETLTAQIADSIEYYLKPKGVAVLISADHQCMSIRGVHKPEAHTVTTKFMGSFSEDAELRGNFLRMVGYGQ